MDRRSCFLRFSFSFPYLGMRQIIFLGNGDYQGDGIPPGEIESMGGVGRHQNKRSWRRYAHEPRESRGV